MTVTSFPARNELTGTAGQTVFNFTFKIYTANDLNVYITLAGQTADDTTDITTAYTVDPAGINNANGGFLTLNSGVSVGDLVTIVSNIPENRTTDYQNSGDFLPETVNDDFDRTVSLVKQQENSTSRTLSFQQSQQNASSLTLPDPVAGAYLTWNGAEDGVTNAGAPGVILPSELNGTTVQMVADASINAGEFLITSGNSANGDGGGSQWLSRAVTGATADGGSLIKSIGNLAIEFVNLFPQGQVNHLMFGASTGASAATNTTAIVNAIAYLAGRTPAGGVLLIPSGSYDVTDNQIIIPNDVFLEGDGSFNTRFFGFGGAGSGVTVQVGATGAQSIRTGISGIGIQGETSVANTALKLLNAERCKVADMFLGAGTVSPSGGGGVCIQVENEASQFCQFNTFTHIRYAAGAGSSIKVVSSAVGGGYNTSGFWSDLSAVGSGASVTERILTVDTNSSSHMFVNCYFEPSDKVDASVKIFGKNIHMINCFIDGHAGKTALETTANATDFKFMGNVDGDIVNASPNGDLMTNLDWVIGKDLEIRGVAGSLRELYFSEGTAGTFGFKIIHDTTLDILTINSRVSGVDTEIMRFTRATGALGFFGSAGGTKPTITGSRAGNAALADLLTEGATLGLWLDSSS